jgi:hypothetical protein
VKKVSEKGYKMIDDVYLICGEAARKYHSRQFLRWRFVGTAGG